MIDEESEYIWIAGLGLSLYLHGVDNPNLRWELDSFEAQREFFNNDFSVARLIIVQTAFLFLFATSKALTMIMFFAISVPLTVPSFVSPVT